MVRLKIISSGSWSVKLILPVLIMGPYTGRPELILVLKIILGPLLLMSA